MCNSTLGIRIRHILPPWGLGVCQYRYQTHSNLGTKINSCRAIAALEKWDGICASPVLWAKLLLCSTQIHLLLFRLQLSSRQLTKSGFIHPVIKSCIQWKCSERPNGLYIALTIQHFEQKIKGVRSEYLGGIIVFCTKLSLQFSPVMAGENDRNLSVPKVNCLRISS